MVTLTRYQRNLAFFASPGTTQMTWYSSLRSFLSMGLDFPVACVLALGLRLAYSPFPHYLAPVDVSKLPASAHRTQLEDVPVNQQFYSRSDLVTAYSQGEIAHSRERGLLRRMFDLAHVNSFWMIAANTHDHLVDADMVKRFQEGTWGEEVVKRRRSRRPDVGEVLPLWRGGPISVTGHSWFVRQLFGVRVYEP